MQKEGKEILEDISKLSHIDKNKYFDKFRSYEKEKVEELLQKLENSKNQEEFNASLCIAVQIKDTKRIIKGLNSEYNSSIEYAFRGIKYLDDKELEEVIFKVPMSTKRKIFKKTRSDRKKLYEKILLKLDKEGMSLIPYIKDEKIIEEYFQKISLNYQNLKSEKKIIEKHPKLFFKYFEIEFLEKLKINHLNSILYDFNLFNKDNIDDLCELLIKNEENLINIGFTFPEKIKFKYLLKFISWGHVNKYFNIKDYKNFKEKEIIELLNTVSKYSNTCFFRSMYQLKNLKDEYYSRIFEKLEFKEFFSDKSILHLLPLHMLRKNEVETLEINKQRKGTMIERDMINYLKYQPLSESRDLIQKISYDKASFVRYY
jgi:hypothetical protein